MNEDKKELLFSLTRKDFVIEAKRGHGKGGQNRNVTNSCCRIRHLPSGAEAQSQDERSYHQNERKAFLQLIESSKFKLWHKMEVARRIGILKDVDKTVEAEMKKIRIDVKDENGRWIEEKK
jgi:peptide chain release factor 1